MTHVRFAALTVLAVLVCVTASVALIRVPIDQPTIQQGIDAAAPGETVLVAAGTYTGTLNRDIDFGGVNIILESEGGAGVTVIDCQAAGRGFFFHSGEDTTSVVRGFTIANAVADSGAGASCAGGSSPKFEECTFTDGMAQVMGGGICCDASSPVVRNCEFLQNTAMDAGRPYAYGGGMACFDGSAPLITSTDFVANSAMSAGGGMYVNHSSPQLTGCLFQGNTLDDYGQGGGALLLDSDGTAFTDCEFRANGAATCVGGGLHITGSDVAVTDCLFVDNISGSGGGLRISQASTATITGCTFIRNVGEWSAAGAIACFFEAAPLITNCTFIANDTQQVWADDSSPTITYCIFAYAVGGTAVHCEGTAAPVIHHCFLFENEGGDTLCGDYHDIEIADPRFCDVENDDLTLCADSPCLAGATWGSLVGAEGEGCAACGSATEERTWGSIKAMYR